MRDAQFPMNKYIVNQINKRIIILDFLISKIELLIDNFLLCDLHYSPLYTQLSTIVEKIISALMHAACGLFHQSLFLLQKWIIL